MATFALIPGAGGDGWAWHLVARELRARGHHPIPVDLPAEDDEAGLTAYTGTVVETVRAHAGGVPDDLVVVGQSMGALTAPLVCEHLDVRLLVLLNAMIPLPGESGGQWWESTGQHEAMEAHARRLGLAPAALEDPTVLFGHDVPTDLFAEAGSRMREQSARPFADPWPLTSWPDVPTRVVAGRDDRLFPVDLQRRLARERLGLVPDVVDGGHAVHLARPVELAALLDSYARELLMPGAGAQTGA